MSDSPANPTNATDLINARAEAKATAQAKSETFQANLDEIRARGAVDLNFFSGIVVPTVMRCAFPPFYCALFALLTRLNPDPEFIMRFALGLPRGFVKTTFLKILTVWLIVYERNSFVLVIGLTEAKALDFVADVDSILSSPQCEQVYGRWTANKIVDNAKRKRGYLNGRMVTLVPMGANTSVRGIQIDLDRPDLIVCDDIQDRDGALSEAQNASLIEWFTASLVKCIATYGSERTIVFLGNMFPGDCLLQILKNNPEWISLVTGAILEDGESLWPELKSQKALFREYAHDAAMGLADIWFAEVQNDPLDSKYRLLSAPIPKIYDYLLDRQADACFLTMDPAGFRKKSDDNVISVHKVYGEVPICTRMHGGKWDPKETVRQILLTAIEEGASVVAIESVGYQQSLLFWVDYFMKKLGITGIKIVELQSMNRAKLMRIEDYIKELLGTPASGGEPQCGMGPGPRAIFTFFAGLYKIGKTQNRDDYLDCPAYQKQVMTRYSQFLVRHSDKAALANLPDVVSLSADELGF